MNLSSTLASLGLICALVVWGCQTPAGQAEHVSTHGTYATSPSPSVGPDKPLPELSIYNLEGLWQDQDGKEISLRSLYGKPQVVAMIYARCKGACPRIIREIQSMEQLLQAAHPGGVGYVLVTMDPDVDTSERLKSLSQDYGLGPEWRLLRGSQDQVRELAAVLGVKYRKVNETDFAHSNTITVLGVDGTMTHQKQELGSGVENSAQAVKALLAEPSPCCAETP